jgi:hypothetical protein
MYYYLFKKLYHIFFPKEENKVKELTIVIPDNLNISNHRPFESCRPIRREPVTRKTKFILELDSDPEASEDFEEDDKKEIRNDFKTLFK